MARFGFVGPTYTGQSKHAAGERCVNLYPEAIESPNGGKGGARVYLVKIPGLKQTHNLPDYPLRCLYTGDGARVFAVSGATLYELFADGTYRELGHVERASAPAQIFANGNQLFVISGPTGYIADGVTVKPVTDCCMGGYIDGYFCALEGANPGDSKTFKLSRLLDGTSWDPLDFAQVEGAPDHIVSMLTDHRQVIFLKQQSTEFFWDSGNADFPIERVDGSFVEQGCIAAWTPKRIDNTVMWLGGDERGAGVVWRMQGYTPVRVSNHAVENAIQGYARAGMSITDAIATVEQVQGHAFYHLHFPSANPLEPTANSPDARAAMGATWTYDCATGLWHERGRWDAKHGLWGCHWARYHCYAWGKHLVGGGDGTGKVYEQSINYQDEAGTPLRWLRSSPHIADPAGTRIFYSGLWVDCQVGVGLSTLLGPDGNERQPVVMARHSNDGGNTWGVETQLAIGKTGEYSFRARQTRCGSGRDRCIEVSGSDPVPIAIVDADIDAEAGIS
jgi:hypothetical protein